MKKERIVSSLCILQKILVRGIIKENHIELLTKPDWLDMILQENYSQTHKLFINIINLNFTISVLTFKILIDFLFIYFIFFHHSYQKSRTQISLFGVHLNYCANLKLTILPVSYTHLMLPTILLV